MIKVLVFTLFAALTLAGVSTDVEARSKAARRAFMHAHPCPHGPDKGSVTQCRGHVVDHIIPLCAGGPDTPENMQWQSTYRSQKKKDNKERAQCKGQK